MFRGAAAEAFLTVLRNAGLHTRADQGSKQGTDSHPQTDASGLHVENQRQGTRIKAAREKLLVTYEEAPNLPADLPRRQQRPGGKRTAVGSQRSTHEWVHQAPHSHTAAACPAR